MTKTRTGLLAGCGLVIALAGAPALAGAQSLSCQAVSPSKQVALIELYTSEGCSSCPPADRWLSALDDSGLGADKVLALALHVDYWDYIGWKDRFADPGFTKRQREHQVRNRLNSIYTPQVVVAGQDFAKWWQAAPFLQSVGQINQRVAPVRLQVSGQWQPDTAGVATISVRIDPADQAGGEAWAAGETALYVALFEDGLSTRVERGENAGEKLEHDKVVRRWLKPVRIGSDGTATLNESVALPADAKPARMGIAAFAQQADGNIAQAVSCQFGSAT